jgi:hypothetical protein
MNSIRSLSGGELKLERVDPKQIEKTLDANATATKTWYAKEKSKIPALDIELPEPAAELASDKPKPAATAAKPTGSNPPAVAPQEARKPPAPAKPSPPPAASP